MIQTYTIYIDGKAYKGESQEVEDARPGAGTGWSGRQPGTINKLDIGGFTPEEIKGRTNLRSHLTRIIDRIGRGGFDPEVITILRGDLHA